MKKVLILVLSSDFAPYDTMTQTQLRTWDSVNVEGVETLFYAGRSSKPDTDKIIYQDMPDSLWENGKRTVAAFEYALQNKEFDYIARVNASHYVDKIRLIEYVQGLPGENVFAGVKVDQTPPWIWGGTGFILSKDVVQKIVDHKDKWRDDLMEDMAMSYVVNDLNIPYMEGKACSINKTKAGWSCLGYGYHSFDFTDFAECKKAWHHIYRCKHDPDRSVDTYVMEQLFKNLMI